MEQVSTQRLALVHPRLANIVSQVYEQLVSEGIVARVVQGLRTNAEQDALYAQGRTTPGKIVTNARGGYSAHNFGYAVDLIPGDRVIRDLNVTRPWVPNWQPTSPDFVRMIEVAKHHGLAAGADWPRFPDHPHFQLPEMPVTPTETMRGTLTAQGLSAFWQRFIPATPTEQVNARENILAV